MGDEWSERVLLKAKRARVPWDEDSPYAKGFWAYAREHYKRCVSLASEIAESYTPKNSYMFPYVFQAVFDKLASPLVYLHETWMLMPTEQKAKYNPELAKVREEAQKMVEEAFKKEPTATPSKSLEEVQNAFSEDLRKLLTFTEEKGHIIIKPAGFLGTENFAKVAEIVEKLGGKYVSAGKESRFEI